MLSAEMPGPCVLDSIQLLCGSDVYNHGIFHNAFVYACHTTVTELDSAFDDNYAGKTPVVAMVIDTLILQWQNDQWHGLGFNYPFAYNGADNLILEFRWQGDDGNSVYDRGWYTPGNRAVNASSSVAPLGVPRNYMPRFRIFCSATGLSEDAREPRQTPPAATASPNPFCREVTIRFPLSLRPATELRICDIAGRLVRALPTSGVRSATQGHVTWDGCDLHGRPVQPGVYFCRLETPGAAQTLLLVVQR